MTNLPKPPNKLGVIKVGAREEILNLAKQGHHTGILWREKVRSFASLYKRHLLKECSLRYGPAKNEYLAWMLALLIQKDPDTKLPDPASLNAALYVSDALRKLDCHNQVVGKVEELEKWLKSTSKSTCDGRALGSPFNPTKELWKEESSGVGSVVIICPTSTSLYSLSVMELCRRFGVRIEGVIIRSISVRRFNQEWKRDGKRLLRKVWRKFVLNSDENSDTCRVSSKLVYDRLSCGFSDVRKFAKHLAVPIFEVDDLREPPFTCVSNSPRMALFTGGGMVGDSFLRGFPSGIINVHLGCLPAYKGMDVVQAPILEGCFNSVGITAHIMVKGLDEGPVVSNFTLNSDGYETLGGLRNELSALSPLMCFDAGIGIQSGRYDPVPQATEIGRQYYIVHELLNDMLSRVMKERHSNDKQSQQIVNLVNQLVD